MLKIINTTLMLLLLTSCSNESASQDNKSASVVKQETVKSPSNATEEKATEKKAEETSETKITVPTTKIEKSASKESLFTITTLEGKKLHINEAKGGLTFKEFKNKGVMLIFFGHRCPPCLKEIPELVKLTNQKHDDLEIVAVEVQNLPASQLKAFKEQRGINYNLVAGEANYDLVSYIGEKANWGGSIPFIVAFDKTGNVQVVHAGGLRAKDLKSIYATITGKTTTAQK